MKSWNQDTALAKFKRLRSQSYDRSSLSESDTRSKLIDYILFDCLGWSEEDVVREERCVESGTYLDYKLATNMPLIVIEAKKSSEPLELPMASNQREYKIGGVLRKCSNTVAAMVQARDYAISKGITFCCVANGEQFVFFRSQNQQGIEWIEHSAVVFRDIDDIEDNFDLFCLHLSKASAEKGRLQQALKLSNEPDNGASFRTLDTSHLAKPRKVDRNPLFPIIGEIVRRVFQDLASEDAESEVLEHCYVESPKKSGKNTPYMDRPAQELSISKKEAGEFQRRITAVLNSKTPAHTEVILLLGSVGVGKSTFIQRFRKVLAAKEIDKSGIWLYLNFKHYSDTGMTLDDFIYGQIDDALVQEYDGLGLNDWSFLKQAYHAEYEKLKRGALQPLFRTDPEQFELEFGKKVDVWSETKVESHFVKLLSAAIKRLDKRIFLIFDNADQLHPSTQSDIFLAAEKLAERIGCYALISMREESYWKNRDAGPLSAFHTTAYHVQPASLKQVLAKRFQYAKNLIQEGSFTRETEFDIKTDELLSVFDRLVQTLLGQDESYIEFIEATAARDTRRALDTIAAFLISGHTNIDAILRDVRRSQPKGFPVPFHEFLNSVVLRDHEVYTEDGCDVFNVFAVTGTSDASNFNRIAVLGRVLGAKNIKSEVGTGYVLIEDVVNDCHSVGILPESTYAIISFLTARRAIETETTIKDDINTSKYLRITASGEYYITKLALMFGYLDLIVFQTPVRGERNFARINKAFEAVNSICGSSSSDRLRRVEARLALVDSFIAYLEKENGASTFSTRGDAFAREAREIMSSTRAAFSIEKNQIISRARSVFGEK
jgi:energy-coupling factor transporter ATP-binding protein EcfA2